MMMYTVNNTVINFLRSIGLYLFLPVFLFPLLTSTMVEAQEFSPLVKQFVIVNSDTGKRADLVLIDGDPLKDINTVRNTEIVFKNGVGFDSKKLFESVKGKVGLY